MSSARGECLLYRVWKMDRWVYSARLILVYRLVGHHWSLDGMLKVRQFFTCKRTPFDPSYVVRYGYNQYNTCVRRRRQCESSILWACFSRNIFAFVITPSMWVSPIADSTNAHCWLADAPILETFIDAVSYTQVEPLPFQSGGYFVIEPQGLFHLNPRPLLAITLSHAKSFLKRHASGLIRYSFF